MSSPRFPSYCCFACCCCCSLFVHSFIRFLLRLALFLDDIIIVFRSYILLLYLVIPFSLYKVFDVIVLTDVVHFTMVYSWCISSFCQSSHFTCSFCLLHFSSSLMLSHLFISYLSCLVRIWFSAFSLFLSRSLTLFLTHSLSLSLYLSLFLFACH